MESYGHFKRKKLVLGVNYLAYAFEKLLFDYVFLFLEKDEEKVKKELADKIKKSMQKKKYIDTLRYIESLEKLFKEFNFDNYERKINCFIILKKKEKA